MEQTVVGSISVIKSINADQRLPTDGRAGLKPAPTLRSLRLNFPNYFSDTSIKTPSGSDI